MLDKEEVVRAKNALYTKDVHVVVGTAEALAECLQPPAALPLLQHTKARLCSVLHRMAMSIWWYM